MNPTTGTFLSVDPVVDDAWDPQAFNAYAYARNNPVNITDPTGMFWEWYAPPRMTMTTISFPAVGPIPGGGGAPGLGTPLNPGVHGTQFAGPGAPRTLEEVRELNDIFEFEPLPPVDPELAELYEDLTILVPAGVAAGAAARATRILPLTRSLTRVTSRFGPKILKQLSKRGWTRESVERTIRNPHRTAPTRDTRHLPAGGRMDDPATIYFNRDGSFVIRNDRTLDIVQVSNRFDPSFKPPVP